MLAFGPIASAPLASGPFDYGVVYVLGVSSTVDVGNLVVTGAIRPRTLVYLTGLAAQGLTGSILVWGYVPPGPDANWVLVPAGPSGGWSSVPAGPGGGWTQVVT